MSEYIGMCPLCYGDILEKYGKSRLDHGHKYYECKDCGAKYKSKKEFGTISPEAQTIIDNHTKVWSECLLAISVWVASCEGSKLINSKMLDEASRLMKIIKKARRSTK